MEVHAAAVTWYTTPIETPNQRDPRRTSFQRDPPDVVALAKVLDAHAVRYVVVGSVAALLHGVPLEPGDMDVAPALDRENLERLARALRELGARQYADEPFGRWETGDDGERRWVAFEPTAADREGRARWRPDPADPASFDHLVWTRRGALDVMPEIAGRYDDLRARAVPIDVDGRRIWVESIADLLATLTIPRRKGDAQRVQALRGLQQALAHEIPPGRPERLTRRRP